MASQILLYHVVFILPCGIYFTMVLVLSCVFALLYMVVDLSCGTCFTICYLLYHVLFALSCGIYFTMWCLLYLVLFALPCGVCFTMWYLLCHVLFTFINMWHFVRVAFVVSCSSSPFWCFFFLFVCLRCCPSCFDCYFGCFLIVCF